MFHSFFLVLWQGLGIRLSFWFLLFLLSGRPEDVKIHKQVFFNCLLSGILLLLFSLSVSFSHQLSSSHHLVVPPARISLTLSLPPPNRSSPPVSPQGYTPYPHRAAVCMFELTALLLHGHVKGSIGVHHLWARPYSSSSVLHVWFV